MKTKLCLLTAALCLLTAVAARASLLGFASDTNFLAATDFTLAISPGYAPGLKDAKGESKEFGFAAGLTYNLSKYAGPLIRVDYLAGNFFMAEGGVQLQYPLTFAGKFKFTPFAIAAGGAALSGSKNNGEPVAIVGTGLAAKLWSWNKPDGTERGHTSLGYEYERWSGGVTANVHRILGVLNWHF